MDLKYDNEQDAIDDQLQDITPIPWVDAPSDVKDEPKDLETP